MISFPTPTSSPHFSSFPPSAVILPTAARLCRLRTNLNMSHNKLLSFSNYTVISMIRTGSPKRLRSIGLIFNNILYCSSKILIVDRSSSPRFNVLSVFYGDFGTVSSFICGKKTGCFFKEFVATKTRISLAKPRCFSEPSSSVFL